MKTNALDITGATQATPIVITSAAHGLSDGANVIVHDVLGNTAANGYFEIDNKATNTFELEGSVGNAAYTSGGKVFEEKSTFRPMVEVDPDEAMYTNETEYYLRAGKIVVNYPNFSNDLVIDYIRTVSTVLTDIPTKYHLMLVSYVVMQIGRPTEQGAPNAKDVDDILNFHTQRFNNLMTQINGYTDQSRRPKRMPEGVSWDELY
jgi:hypothetical protein